MSEGSWQVGRLQPFVKRLIAPAVRSYLSLRVEGAEHVPSRGPFIVAPNHPSMWDIPVLVVACPRTLTFMANADVMDTAFKHRLFTELGGFPVRLGARDVGSLRSARAVLRSGRGLAMFPEATRSFGSLLPFRPGVARIALASGSPIVPVAIEGTSDIAPGGRPFRHPARVRVSFGEPIRPEAAAGGRERVPALTGELRERVRELLFR